MNIKGIILFSLSIFILNSFTSSPSSVHTDCIDAYQICSLSDYYFPALNGPGEQEPLNITNTSLQETNSLWLQFTAISSGELEFVIVPDNPEDDIDFILYQGATCDNKMPLRVMTSGEMVGNNSNQRCIGQTGLQKISADLNEADGCYDLDDNFLKPQYLDAGETYFLLINNFNSTGGLSILFSGDAGLELENTCEYKSDQDLDLNLFPNPVASDLNVRLYQEIDIPVNIQIFDQSGKLFYNSDMKKLSDQFSINVVDYPSGKYFLKVSNEHKVELKSFVKI